MTADWLPNLAERFRFVVLNLVRKILILSGFFRLLLLDAEIVKTVVLFLISMRSLVRTQDGPPYNESRDDHRGFLHFVLNPNGVRKSGGPRGCYNKNGKPKTAFTTKKAAEKAIPKTSVRLAPYACELHGWHLGHRIA